MQESYEIPCVGVDNKLHVGRPEDTHAKCGIAIVSKEDNVIYSEPRYSCYECTY